MKEPSSLRIKRQGSKDFQSRLSKGERKKKRKDGKEEDLKKKKKKWAFSFNPKLLSGKKAKSSVPEREIKSKLSPHKESFPVKGMKIVYCSTENENHFQTLG